MGRDGRISLRQEFLLVWSPLESPISLFQPKRLPNCERCLQPSEVIHSSQAERSLRFTLNVKRSLNSPEAGLGGAMDWIPTSCLGCVGGHITSPRVDWLNGSADAVIHTVFTECTCCSLISGSRFKLQRPEAQLFQFLSRHAACGEPLWSSLHFGQHPSRLWR